MADPKDIQILKPDGTWQSLLAPGKGGDVTKADFDALKQKVEDLQQQLAALDGLPYDHDSSIKIEPK